MISRDARFLRFCIVRLCAIVMTNVLRRASGASLSIICCPSDWAELRFLLSMSSTTHVSKVLLEINDRFEYGAKHSPPGVRLGKSKGSYASKPEHPEILIPMVKLYPNEEFSTATLMIFDVDSNYVNPRFWIGVQMWTRASISDNILESWETSFCLKSSFIESLGVEYFS